MTDFRASIRRTASARRARQIMSLLRGRLADVQYVGWPRLAASLKAELADVEAVARARGFLSEAP